MIEMSNKFGKRLGKPPAAGDEILPMTLLTGHCEQRKQLLLTLFTG